MMISAPRFQKIILGYYRTAGRNLAWRRTRDPYRILVSEIMLQQTQVARVEGFYGKFIGQFPDFRLLAKAKTADVLRAWQGLGYNRRALALQRLAREVLGKYGSRLSRDRKTLESLPGIGNYTASAIRTFAFNEPEIFIETNIRRVFIHFFFPKRRKVHDREIRALVARTLDSSNPRVWYWALMDYGAMLGATQKENPNRRSAHYAKQSKFAGSDRELRGKILRLLLAKKKNPQRPLFSILPQSRARISKITSDLKREGFIN
jgi:A/G-specific adenine glycosylase